MNWGRDMSDLIPDGDPRLDEMRKTNNPHNEPTGHFTGRCMRCGSDDLWDDNSAYGCNACGGWWCGLEPRLIRNR
jgi:hypothetical protein